MSLDLKKIYADFPSLKDTTHYLDSAASSLTPECVIDAMNEYYREYRANIHRGLYGSAERASEAYESARKDVARFIGAEPDEVIFTGGATIAANQLVYALEQTLGFRQGDEIVMSIAEHHALLVPLQELAKRQGLVVKYAQMGKDFLLDTKDLREIITDRTRVVAVMGASNVTGSMFDVPAEATGVAKEGVERPVIIRDITALVGHAPMDVKTLGADFAFFSGHKICGPTGVGVLWGRKDVLATLAPGFYGGGMITEVTTEGASYQSGVDRFEAGTPNIAGVIGLGEAVRYLERVGLSAIHEHARELTRYAQEQLGGIPGVTLISAPPEHNVGTISFTVQGIHPHDVAQICADNGVAVRPGHHCAEPLHRALGIGATTRASLYLYNTKEDIDYLAEAIRKSITVFK